MATLIGLAAVPAMAKQETVVIAPTVETVETAGQDDPAMLINHAAARVKEGKLAQARAVYERVEAMTIDYKVETTQGSWMYPAEVARRGLKEIAARDNHVNLASAR